MAEETVQETETVEATEAQMSAESETEPQQNGPPNPFAFAGFLLGGWVALMIVFILFAAVAMTLVGAVAG